MKEILILERKLKGLKNNLNNLKTFEQYKSDETYFDIFIQLSKLKENYDYSETDMNYLIKPMNKELTAYLNASGYAPGDSDQELNVYANIDDSYITILVDNAKEAPTGLLMDIYNKITEIVAKYDNMTIELGEPEISSGIDRMGSKVGLKWKVEYRIPYTLDRPYSDVKPRSMDKGKNLPF